MARTVIMTLTPKGIVEPVALAKCKRNLFRNKANTGRLDYIRLYIVMYVARCKWNQKAEADICSPSQMISRDTRLPTLSSLRVKFSQNSWNMSVLLKKHTGHQIMKLNILADEDVKILRSDNGGEYTSNTFTRYCAENRNLTRVHCSILSTTKWSC